MRPKIVAVAGPTASGKTALSIDIAKKYGGEIVSCDSMQIYKYMDIGTAKPSKAEQSGIPHYMIDEISPDENFCVVDYSKLAQKYIDDILSRGKLPVLVGGTGLYLDSVINNVGFSEAGSDEKYRSKLKQLAKAEGNEAVHRLLERVDPSSAEKIHPNNLRRVIRALEIYKTTGKTMAQVNEESVREPLYDTLIIGLNMDRELLYDRINRRVDLMMEQGLEGEVRKILDMGTGKDATALQAIGYKEFIEYFDGKISKEEAVEKIKRESRRYAKRQLTWLRRNDKINWLMLQNDYNYTKILIQSFTLINKFGIIERGKPYGEVGTEKNGKEKG